MLAAAHPEFSPACARARWHNAHPDSENISDPYCAAAARTHIVEMGLRTLKEVEERAYRLVARCPGCGDFQTLRLKELIAELGPDFDFVSYPGLLRDVVSCLRCGRPGLPVVVMEYSPESGFSPQGIT